MKLDTRHVIATLAAVAILVALVAWTGRPPDAKSSGAAPTEFSAGRAMETIRDLTALGPHGIAEPETPSHVHAREVVVSKLRALGLDPLVRETPTCGVPGKPDENRCESIRNVVARIEGREGAPALMLAAHYDSVHHAPGAADDGAGVATVLEIARAILAGGTPRRAIVLLLDDGEEVGLFGARAFVREDPSAHDVRVVLNFEARGTAGPAAMFETSEGAAWLVDLYGRAVERPVASSIVYALYKALPNDTDLTVFKAAGMQGMNFAFADRVWNYHTPNDDVDHLDARSVQHMGDQGLAVARRLAADALDEPRGAEEVYFELFSRCLVRWRGSLVWPLEIVALVDLALAIAIVVVRRRASPVRIVVGAGRALLALLAAWASPALVALVVQLRGGALPSPVDPPMHAWIAFVAAAIAASVTTLSSLRGDDGDDALPTWIGALLLVALLSLLVAAKLPAGSYLFTLPVILGALFLGGSAAVDRSRTWPMLAMALASFALAAILWMPLVRVLLVMVGAGVPMVTALPIAVLVLLGAPLAVGVRGRARAIVPALAGSIAFVAALSVG